jgi:hypothetical protein
MENHFAGKLDAGASTTGLQDRIHLRPTFSSCTTQDNTANLARHETDFTVRSLGTETRTGNHSGLPSVSGGLLVDFFLSTEKDQRLEAHSEPQTSEQIYQTNEVQNGNSSVSASLPNQEQMGGVTRMPTFTCRFIRATSDGCGFRSRVRHTSLYAYHLDCPLLHGYSHT